MTPMMVITMEMTIATMGRLTEKEAMTRYLALREARYSRNGRPGPARRCSIVAMSSRSSRNCRSCNKRSITASRSLFFKVRKVLAANSHERVLSVRHWTDAQFTFTTTRSPGLRFANGQFVMLGLKIGAEL